MKFNRLLTTTLLTALLLLNIISTVDINKQVAEGVLTNTQHYFSQIVKKAASSTEGEIATIKAFNSTLIWIAHCKGTAGNCNGIFMERSTDGGQTWSTFTIDGGATRGAFIDMDILGDGGFTSGGIYIAYYFAGAAGDALFARSTNGGSTWATTTIESAGVVGQYISIDALDTNNLFVAYFSATCDCLRYAESSDAGSNWTPSSVDDPVNVVGSSTSIFVRDSNVIYIVYNESTLGDLKLARSFNGGTSWTLTTAVSTNSVGSANSMDVILGATNNTDTLVVSTQDSTTTAVKFVKSTNGGSSWDIPVTVFSATSASITSIDAFSTSIIYIAVDTNALVSIGITSSGGSSWTTQNIDSTDGFVVGSSTDSFLYVLNENTVFLTSGLNDGSTGRGNLYFYKPDTLISPTTFSPSTEARQPSIDTVGASNVFVAYFNPAGVDLMFTKSTDGGQTWITPVIADGSGTSRGTNPTIFAVDTNTLYIVYGDGAASPGPIFFVKSTNGGSTWDTPVTIDTNALAVGTTEPLLAMVALNSTHIYVAYRDDDGSGAALAFARSTNSGSSWTLTTFAASNSEGWGPSIDVLLVGTAVHIHIIHYAFTSDIWKTRKSTNGGDSFAAEVTIDSGIGGSPDGSSIDIVDQNNIFTAYDKPTTTELRFAKSSNGGSSWTASTVDTVPAGAISGGFPSLRAISTSRIFITYSQHENDNSAEELAHSSNGGSTWTLRPIDGTFNPSFVGGPSKIEIISNDRIYAVYNANGRNTGRFADINLTPAGGGGSSTPSITSFNDSPDPVTQGNPITFTISWADGDDTQTKAHVCKSNSITPSVSGGSCPGGSFVDSTFFTASNPVTLQYTTSASDLGSNTYFVFVCDDDSHCSGTSSNSGTFSITFQSTGYTVNIFNEFNITQPLSASYRIHINSTGQTITKSFTGSSFSFTALGTLQTIRLEFKPNTADEYYRIQSFQLISNPPSPINFYMANNTSTFKVRAYHFQFADFTGRFSQAVITVNKVVNGTSLVIDSSQLDETFGMNSHLVIGEWYGITAAIPGESRMIGKYQATTSKPCGSISADYCENFNIGNVLTTQIPNTFGESITFDAWHDNTRLYASYSSAVTGTTLITLTGINETGAFFLTKQTNTDNFMFTTTATPTSSYSINFYIEHPEFGKVNQTVSAEKNFVGTQRFEGTVFNGAAHANVTNYGSINFAGQFSITVILTFPTTAQPSTQAYIVENRQDSLNNYFMYFDNSTKKVNFGFMNAGTTKSIASVKNSWATNTVFVISGTYDPAGGTNNMNIYVNGAVDNSATLTGNPPGPTGSLYIAGRSTGTGFCKCNIAQVQLHSRALALVEESGLFQQKINPKDSRVYFVEFSPKYFKGTQSDKVFFNQGTNSYDTKFHSTSGIGPNFMIMTYVPSAAFFIGIPTSPWNFSTVLGFPAIVVVLGIIANLWKPSESHIGGLVTAFAGALFMGWGLFDASTNPAFPSGTIVPLNWQTGIGATIGGAAIIYAMLHAYTSKKTVT